LQNATPRLVTTNRSSTGCSVSQRNHSKIVSAGSSHAGGAPAPARTRAAAHAVTECWKLKPPAPAAPPDVELGIVRFYGITPPAISLLVSRGAPFVWPCVSPIASPHALVASRSAAAGSGSPASPSRQASLITPAALRPLPLSTALRACPVRCACRFLKSRRNHDTHTGLDTRGA